MCPEMTKAVEIEGLRFAYDPVRPILQGVDLSLEKGTLYGLVGPNGSGKSTLVRLMLGLLPQQGGRISLLGVELSRFGQWNRVGYLPQKAASFNQGFPLTVEELVGLPLLSREWLPWRRKTSRPTVQQWLETVELGHLAGALVGRLSGGQQQRALLAQTLITRPELILLDEPMVGMDAPSRRVFLEVLARWVREQEATVVMVTHDLRTAADLDRVICLEEGQVYQHQLPAHLVVDSLMDGTGHQHLLYHSHTREVG